MTKLRAPYANSPLGADPLDFVAGIGPLHASPNGDGYFDITNSRGTSVVVWCPLTGAIMSPGKTPRVCGYRTTAYKAVDLINALTGSSYVLVEASP